MPVMTKTTRCSITKLTPYTPKKRMSIIKLEEHTLVIPSPAHNKKTWQGEKIAAARSKNTKNTVRLIERDQPPTPTNVLLKEYNKIERLRWLPCQISLTSLQYSFYGARNS